MSIAQALARVVPPARLAPIASRVNQYEVGRDLVRLIEACYHARAFAREGDALELIASTLDIRAAGGFADLAFASTRPVSSGLTLADFRKLDAVNLASLLCLVVVCVVDRGYMGPTQIKLIARDCEQAIAADSGTKPAA